MGSKDNLGSPNQTSLLTEVAGPSAYGTCLGRTSTEFCCIDIRKRVVSECRCYVGFSSYGTRPGSSGVCLALRGSGRARLRCGIMWHGYVVCCSQDVHHSAPWLAVAALGA